MPSAPAELHRLHEELERLLVEGQPPQIRLLLQARFLRDVMRSGEAAWGAYGFAVAQAFLHRLSIVRSEDPKGVSQTPDSGTMGLAGFGPEVLEAFAGLVEECERKEAPPWAQAARWQAALVQGRAALERERLLLQSVLKGLEVCPTGNELAGTDRDRESGSPPWSGAVLVPVIAEVQSSRELTESLRGIRAAGLVRLMVDAQLLYRRAGGAELTVDGVADPDSRQGFEQALALLSRLPLAGAPSAGHQWFRAHWHPSAAHITGRSATLGFLLAAQSARGSFSLGLGRRSLSPGVGVTGDLDGELISPVESIALKVQACFFGPVRALVVPADQREEALREVRRLEQMHPGRQLLILGARRIGELLAEPAVMATATRPPVHLLRALFRRIAVSRGLVGALVGLFLLLLGVAGREMWLSRPWPTDARWQNEDLVLRNASGREYRRLHLSPGPPPGEEAAFQRSEGRIAQTWDLDGRGCGEVLAIAWRDRYEGNDLRAWSGRGRSLWGLSCNAGPNGGPLESDDLRWRFFCAAGRGSTGSLRMLAVRRSRLGSLCLVDLVDTGVPREIGLLANDGHLERAFRADADGDGRAELFLIGTDNESDQGLVVLVDPSSMALPPSSQGMDGWTWLTQPAALGRGVVVALRFPRDDLVPSGRPSCTEGRLESGLLQVTTQTMGPDRCVVFSIDLHDARSPLAVRAVLIDAYRQGLALKVPPLRPEDFAREEERLVRGTTFLTPEGWAPVPVRSDQSPISSRRVAGRD